MSDLDNAESSCCLVVDDSTTSEVASALKEETDKVHQVFREALHQGDAEAANTAYETFRDVDNKRLQFDRAVEAVKEILDSSE
jgi:cytochrome c556